MAAHLHDALLEEGLEFERFAHIVGSSLRPAAWVWRRDRELLQCCVTDARAATAAQAWLVVGMRITYDSERDQARIRFSEERQSYDEGSTEWVVLNER